MSVHGDLDLASAPTMRQRAARVLDSGTTALVLDLSGVDFCDSAGLGMIVAVLKRARTRGARLRVVCPEERIRALFTLCGLDAVVDLHPDLAAACAP